MDIRFTNRWAGFSMEELERMLWMKEPGFYLVKNDDLTINLGKEIEAELRKRGEHNESQLSCM